jgi:hypothetical protein
MFLSHKHEAQQFLKTEAEQNKMQEYFLPSVTIYSVVACSMWISESALERAGNTIRHLQAFSNVSLHSVSKCSNNSNVNICYAIM